MKKLAVLAALALLSLPVLADVGVVNLNNWDNDFPVLGIPAGQTAYVQLLGGATGSALAPVVSTTDKTTSIFKVDPDGHFDAGVGIVPGLTGAGPAQFQLQAWTGAAGSTYATATTKGQSAMITGTANAWNDAAVPAVPAVGAPLALTASVNLGAVPEPSTIALGILGAGAMLLIRRRS